MIAEVTGEAKKTVKGEGEQLTNIVTYLWKLAQEENFKARKLWLDKLKDNMYLDELKEKYRYKPQKNSDEIIIGEYDDPERQHQDLVKFNMIKSGNLVIFGAGDSGKETLLNTIIYGLISTYSSEDLWMYILDLGSETFKIWKDAPHIGDIILSNDVEKMARFFKNMKEDLERRKEILSNYNGDYEYYLKVSKEKMPRIVIFINGFENFGEKYLDAFEDNLLLLIREGPKYGMVFGIVASSTNDFRYRLLQNLKSKICLNVSDDSDYVSVFNQIGDKKLPHTFGRGFIEINEEIFEFQTAKICRPENYNGDIKEIIEKIKNENSEQAPEIRILPEVVQLSDLDAENIEISKIPIGIANKGLQTVYYNFSKNFVTVFSAKKLLDAALFVNNIEKVIRNIENVKTVILDYEKITEKGKKDQSEIYSELCEQIRDEKRTPEHTCVVIYGIEKFLNSSGEISSELNEILQLAKEKENYSFLFVENAQKIKDYAYEEWYKNYISNDSTMWIGDGIQNQYVLETNASFKDLVENCGRTFGYLNIQNKTTLVKLLGMQEEEEEDE